MKAQDPSTVANVIAVLLLAVEAHRLEPDGETAQRYAACYRDLAQQNGLQTTFTGAPDEVAEQLTALWRNPRGGPIQYWEIVQEPAGGWKATVLEVNGATKPAEELASATGETITLAVFHAAEAYRLRFNQPRFGPAGATCAT